MSISVKKGDTVLVISGKDRGKTAKVKMVLPKKNKVVLERINIAKRHTKPSRKNAQGGVVELEKPINRSNVMVYCQKCAKGVKIGVKILKDKTKSRFCKKCTEIIDKA
jgi:large subunit ribosomal protein L24